MNQILKNKCPHCGGVLQRISRSKVDRLISIFVYVQRYKCEEPDCQWQGLIKIKQNNFEKTKF